MDTEFPESVEQVMLAISQDLFNDFQVGFNHDSRFSVEEAKVLLDRRDYVVFGEDRGPGAPFSRG